MWELQRIYVKSVRYSSGGTNFHYHFNGRHFNVHKCKVVSVRGMTDSRRRWAVCPGSFTSGAMPPPPVRTEFEDDLTPDAVCKLYHSLELHQDFSAFHLLVQSISRIRCAVSSNFNLPKLKRIKKNYLNFRRVEKSFCLLVQEKDEIPTLFCSLFCFGVRYVEWGVGVGWERTNKGQGGWKGFTLEVSAIETAKVCKSEK